MHRKYHIRDIVKSNSFKVIVNFIVAMLLVYISFRCISLNNSVVSLTNTVNTCEETIAEQAKENKELTEYIEQYTDTVAELLDKNAELETTVQDLLEELDELARRNETVAIETTKRDFKSFMPYNAITDRTSRQWALQQVATTNEDGVRCIDGLPMIAIGTGWGPWVGDKVLVVCENGNSFLAIVGDIKANAHTDAENKTTTANGCRCEFIVDLSKLNDHTKQLGNMVTFDEYAGYVVSIVKVK